MKKIILALLLTTSVFGEVQYNVEKIETKLHYQIFELACISPVGHGGDVTFTGFHNARFILSNGENDPFTAREITSPDELAVEGCQKEALQKLSDEATMSFGFLWADITIIKKTAKKAEFHRAFNGCFKRYREEMRADLGYGLVFSTGEKSTIKPSDECEEND